MAIFTRWTTSPRVTFHRLPKATARLRQSFFAKATQDRGYSGLLSDSQKNNLFFLKIPYISLY